MYLHMYGLHPHRRTMIMRMLSVTMGMYVPFVVPSLTPRRCPCVTSVNCNIVRIAFELLSGLCFFLCSVAACWVSGRDRARQRDCASVQAKQLNRKRMRVVEGVIPGVATIAVHGFSHGA